MENKKRKLTHITKENDKTFLQDGLSTADIRKKVQYIREYLNKPSSASLDEKITYLRGEQESFVERYPMLFEMCIKPDFNYEHLNYFLQMRDDIINDKISSEDASIKVGKEWFDKFVDVSKLPKKEG